MSATERLLRETLGDPRLRVEPGVGLLDRARYEGERLRRRRRRRSVGLSVAATLAVVGTGAVLSPRLAGHPLLARPAGPAALHVDDAVPAPLPGPAGRRGPVAVPHPTLWTERLAGRQVVFVAAYDGRRLCVQPATAADAVLRPPVCAPRAAAGTGLLAGPVGGAAGLRQADAGVNRVVVLARDRASGVVAHLPGGATYLGYLQAAVGAGQGRLFEVVMPTGQRVERIDAVSVSGEVIGAWTPRR